MTLEQYASLFNLLAMFVVAGGSAWLMQRYPRPFFSAWVKAYSFGLVMLTVETLAQSVGHSIGLSLLIVVLMNFSAFFFFVAGDLVRERRSRRWERLIGVGFLCSLGLLAIGSPFHVLFLPSLLAHMAGMGWLGYAIYTSATQDDRYGRSWLGVPLILLAVWPLTLPLFAPWHIEWLGFAGAGTLHMVVGMGMVIFLLESVGDQLRATNRELVAANEVKMNFVSTVSHELRTPLTRVAGYLEFLEDGLGGPLTPEQRRFVEEVRLGTNDLAGLIEDLIEALLIQSGMLVVKQEPVSMAAAVALAITEPTATAAKKGVALTTVLPPHLPEANADTQRVAKVIRHLVDNALKFTPTGGRVTVAAIATDEAIELTVSDTGIGIAPSELERVFETFYQVDGTATRAHGGTGLGLSITRAIVKAMGGELSVRSELGQGSAFTLSLPRASCEVAEWPVTSRGKIERAGGYRPPS